MSTDVSYRLSPQQARIWELSGGDLPPFATRCAIALRGELDRAALENALSQLVSQHEILRAVYLPVAGSAVLKLPEAAPRIPISGISGSSDDPGASGADPQDRMRAIRERMLRMPAAAALSGELIALAPRLHVLLLCVPSLSADASSLVALTAELGGLYRAIYRAHTGDRSEAFPEEVMQYLDVAEVWHELLGSAEAEPGRRYWRGCDLGAVLSGGIAAPPPPPRLARVGEPVAPALARALEAFAAAERCAVPTVVLACWQLLLARLSGSDAWSVAVALDGRSHEGLERAIGAFVRYLPLHASVPMQQPFRAWLRSLTEARAEALEWQDAFDPASAGRRYPRFSFSSVELPPPCTAGGLELELLAVDAVSERSDVELVLVRRGAELELVLRHDPDPLAAALPGASPRLLLERLIALLEGALAGPQRSLGELPLLGPGERALLAGFAAGRGDWSCEHTVHELFAAQAAATPERTAVVCGDDALDYRELARRAHQLAHHLRSLGVGPEAHVAILLPPSVEVLVAILGILEAGGAYVPLDPAYPRARLELVLRDVDADVLITRSELRDRAGRHGARVVALDEVAPAIAAMPEAPLPAAATPDHLAYIIYTSGSTGQPKGVMIAHRSAVNLTFALEQRIYARFPGPLRIAMTAPLTFDASVKQWLQLLRGHTLFVVPDEVRHDPAELLSFLRLHAIDALDVTPSVLRLLLAQGLGADPGATPRLVLVGGEAIDDATWQAMAAQARPAYVNVYGPTECTVDTTAELVAPGSRPSIGRPLANVRVHLLDGHMNPVPVGVPGEIYVGGAGLAQGYLDRPDLTAERFVRDPFGEPPDRLYRTGDLGRHRADGAIEFLGRVDHQVKLRGFRIELGEIEAVLEEHPAIEHAVATVREDAPGQPRLVAYVVAPAAPAPAELREHLQERLPAYMLPQAFVLLEALPLTPHGKIDRRALPAPDARPATGQAFVPLRTPTQAAIAEVWMKVLGIDRVGLHDDFFALGGHSLASMQVVTRLRARWQIELPLRAFFEVPTVAGLAERVEAARGQAWPEIPPAPRDVPGEVQPPLSFAQQRLWFLDQLEPGHPFYNIAAAVRMRGPLDVAALAQSIQAVVARHEVLRTSFPAAAGQPRQAIAQAVDVPLVVQDLRALPPSEREDEVQRRAIAEAQAPFDLGRGPLLRATLLALSDEEHAVLFTVHHIAFDGWSAGVLLGELGALYQAFVLREAPAAPALPALPVQYADYAVWQRRWFDDDGVRAAELAHWTQALAGAPPFLELPTDRPRPPVQRHRGAIHTFALPEALVAAVDALGQRAGATRFMTLLAAFSVLLGRYARAEDVCIGSPVAGRVRPELEALIGFFVNTLVLRCDLSGDPTVQELLGRVRAMTLAAYEHQNVPFEEVVDALAPPRDTSRTPLFQVMFVLQNAPMPAFSIHELTLEPLTVDTGISRFDLLVMLENDGDALHGSIEYDTDLFDGETIARMAGHYVNLLGAFAGHPGRRIAELELLGADERRRLLIDHDRTYQVGATGACVHELVAAAAARHAQATAVVFGAERASYRELELRANRLAHHLRDLGAGPGGRVAICLPRSVDLVVAILAVLEAGAAYVPLDPAYPHERLAFMLADSRAAVLLTHTALADRCPEHTGLRVCLDAEADAAAIAARPSGAVPGLARSRDAAYVLYTSGSTGRPKGVVLPHAALCNLIAWQLSESPAGSEAHTAQFAPVSFDVHAQEIFATWCAGGRLVLVSDDERRDPGLLLDLLVDQGITRLFLPFVALRLLCEAAVLRDVYPAALREVITAGEQLQITPAIARFFARLPGCRLQNQYGPTEAHVVSSFTLAGDPASWPALPPIGAPIAGVRIHVLDPARAPCPVGVPGEVYLGGACLAHGYLDRPALTAERFVPDPFAPGERLYRTGDLARRGRDGQLCFLGRADDQVKLHGFRIEPGEIEAALARHPGVEQATVVVREDRPGERRLVAYWVPRGAPTSGSAPAGAPTSGSAPTIDALREHLARTLPPYMIPARLVALPRLPLGPSGKVARAALPAPEPDGSITASGTAVHAAPRTETERRLADIWSRLLGVDRVGIHDNLFGLGAHSLQVIEATHAARSAGLPLSPRLCFQHQTIAELARALDDARRTEPALSPRLPALARAAPGEPFPMSELQQAYWLGRLAAFELGQIGPSSYAELELLGEIDPARLERAWERMIARHDMLRAVALADGRLQALADVPRYRIDLLDLGERAPEEAERELAAARRRLERRTFLPEAWPLFELRATRLPGGRARLHFVCDLLLTDVRSSEILLAEVARLYDDPDAELPILDVGFADYARALAADPDVATAAAYWRGRLAELPPPPPLPTIAGPEPAGAEPAGMTARRRHLDAATWDGLAARAGRAGLTPSAVLCAAFADVLAAWSGTYRFTINLMYGNRRPLHPHVERLVGNFSSTLLLEVDASAPRFDERARRLADQLAGDLEHASFGGVRVLRELNARRGSPVRAGMPVVFSSILPLAARPTAPAPAPARPARVAVVHSGVQTPQVTLECVVSLVEGRPRLTWNAVEGLFPPGVLDAMFASYGALVEELATGDAAWTAARRAALPADQLAAAARVNDPAASLPGGLLHEPFLAQARTRPDAPAVIAPERTLTYAELDAHARAVATALRADGVQARELVAVVMDKHWAQIAAVLGALLAGAAYLPIDPAVPAERLRYILDHAGVRRALTTAAVDARVTWPEDVTRLHVDQLDPEPGAALTPPAADPGDLAYVIYTSGSTGVPKGVMISHRGALNTIADINERFAVTPDDRVLALSSLSFDLSVYDVFGTLAAGATIVVPAPAPVPEPARWLARVLDDRVTIVNAVPALVEMLVEQAEAAGAGLGALRLVMMSGDWIPVPLPDRVRALGPGVHVVSLGGATEASIWSVIHPIERVDPAWSSIPYGRALRNQSAFVLDEQLEPCPVWTRGMIYLGGAGLAEGYLHDPDRTDAAFLRHPRTGERLYRTGDLGRLLPGGELEILGREDFQVKISGYRVELAEIEAVLSQHPAVAAAAVIAAGDPRGARRLIGFVVPARDALLTPEAVRQIAAERLPEYMVPGRVAILDALPLTANAKVDRAALAALAASGGEGASGGEPPRDPLEQALARLMTEMVDAATVGIHDDFFALGGNSLSALRLTTRVARELGHDLSLSQLFAAPTVARLARLLRDGGSGGSGAPWSPLVSLSREGSGPPFFCVHPVGGGVLCFAELARHLAGERPLYALEARGLERDLAPLDRIEDMAALYLRAVREQQPRGPYAIGGWSMGAVIAFEMAQQLAAAGEEVALVAMLDPPRPRTAPALRVDAKEAEEAEQDPAAAPLERFLADRTRGLLPADLTEEQARRLLGVFRAHERALEAYVPRPYGGRIALLRATGGDDGGAWPHLADALVRPVPGDHYSMLREPHVRALAAELRALLAAAEAPDRRAQGARG